MLDKRALDDVEMRRPVAGADRDVLRPDGDMESRNTLAYGVLLSKPGALRIALWQVKPPPSHHFFWIAGCANHFMYSSAISFLSEYLTTEMPCPPSCACCTLPLGIGKKPEIGRAHV